MGFARSLRECCLGGRREKRAAESSTASHARAGFDWGAIFVPQDPEASLANLRAKGGVGAVLVELGLDPHPDTAADQGIAASEVEERSQRYGRNALPQTALKSWWRLFFAALRSITLIALIVAGAVALGTGLAQDTTKGWADGSAVIIAVAVVASVTATSDFAKQLAFRRLEARMATQATARVIRGSSERSVGIEELVVGDVVSLRASDGDAVPADGLLLQSDNDDKEEGLKVNESSLTGESDEVRKDTKSSPFLLAGSLVTQGSGRFVVTAVGVNSFQGDILRSSSGQPAQQTPLQQKLDKLARRIGIVGILAALATFAVMVILKATAKEGSELANKPWLTQILDAFILAAAIIVVAVPEGLPLAVTLSLAYASNMMMREQCLVRHLDACEVAGSVTDICTDKTGTLTENRMQVTECWLAGRRYQPLQEERTGSSSDRRPQARRSASLEEPLLLPTPGEPAPSTSLGLSGSDDLPLAAKALLSLHLSLNSTAALSRREEQEQEGGLTVIGSKTEGAGLLLVEKFAEQTGESGEGKQKSLLYQRLRKRCRRVGERPQKKHKEEEARSSPPGGEALFSSSNHDCTCPVNLLKQFPFSSERKRMSTLLAITSGVARKKRLIVTGAAEVVLSLCSSVVTGFRDQFEEGREDLAREVERVASSELPLRHLDDSEREGIKETVIGEMAKRSLRTLALAFKQDVDGDGDGGGDAAALETNLTLFCVLGLKDPLRQNVRQAIASVQRAGVKVRLVSGDNPLTAGALAREAGILLKDRGGENGDGDLVLTGPVFRTLTPAQLDMILPRLAVLARSSPNDKMMLVQRLNGAALPKNRQEWEAQHPSRSWDDDRGALLPGYRQEWEEARRVELEGSTRTGLANAVVATTGDGTNDAPALKAADVGLALGLAGTEVAKRACDIVITDDRFESIVTAVLWGRSVVDGARSFVQLQLVVNVAALLLTFIAAVLSRPPPLSPISMLWVNLAYDSLGGLALGARQPSPDLLARKPLATNASIVSRRMMRNILVVSAFELGVCLFLLEGGVSVLGLDEAYISTFVFNTFVLLQLLNEFNSRSIDNWLEGWKGLWRDKLFLAVVVFLAAAQVLIVELGGSFFQMTPLPPFYWLLSVGIALTVLPVGWAARAFIPVAKRPSDGASAWTTAFEKKMQERLERALKSKEAFPSELMEQLSLAAHGKSEINSSDESGGTRAPRRWSPAPLSITATAPSSSRPVGEEEGQQEADTSLLISKDKNAKEREDEQLVAIALLPPPNNLPATRR